jgi:N-acetylated-alpha-linked acidic dipeptidase
MARVLGLEALRMADADVLPYDYVAYAAAISSYIEAAKNKVAGDSTQEKKASDSSARTTKKWWKTSEPKSGTLDFSAVQAAAARFSAAAERAHGLQIAANGDLAKLNLALRQAETGLISEQGLPNRPWYKHTIYAPGEFTGYSAVVIPGVNEALDARDLKLATQQLTVLTQALTRAAQALEGAR